MTRMATELDQLCGKISSTVEEKINISVTEDKVANIKGQGDRCLMGKYGRRKGLTRSYSFLKEVQGNMWLLEFAKEE